MATTLKKISILFTLIFSAYTLQADTLRAVVNNGNWSVGTTWSAGRVPANGDVVIIPLNININLSGQNGNKSYVDLVVYIYGNLHLLQGQKLYIDCNSYAEIFTFGSITRQNGGSKFYYECGGSNEISFPSSGALNGPASYGRNPLPIELISFTAHQMNNTIALNWQTSTETNNDLYTIEKSIDGSTFNVVGEVKGQGNSSTLQSYDLIDKNPTNGISYYRLKQTDFDGKFDYSNIISVNYQKQIFAADITIYPNPCNSCNSINVVAADSDLESIKYELYDVTGKVVLSDNIQKLNGIFEIDFKNKLNAGIYFLKINSDKNLIKKIIVQ